jgi:hypothetical protein
MSQWSPDQQKQMAWLTRRVHEAGEGIEEAIKWGRLTFTLGGNWHHWLCAIAVTNREVKLMFHKGSLLDDPARLLQGDGRYVRHVEQGQASADPEALTALVQEAIAHQTDL